MTTTSDVLQVDHSLSDKCDIGNTKKPDPGGIAMNAQFGDEISFNSPSLHDLEVITLMLFN